jgi:hypothetical protein
VAEGQAIGRSPNRVYTVGDAIRLSVSFLSEANVEEVEASFYLLGEDPEGRPGHSVVHATISFEGTVEESEVVRQSPGTLPIKRHTAVLVSFVDKDHPPGAYVFSYLWLRTAEGRSLQWLPEDPTPKFRIEPEPTKGIEDVQVELLGEPEE